ncbi:EAL domain-containing protein [Methylotenera mobilis]|uniref:Diguanylate cyclase/phosphodiesterase with PAS/PAC sensor(S) n=1 Tax=Methylotenera mobilis (strain JLW8 / ATCC BAA-1282 / DSM 17540) TaxID=583345 RepID=C6WTL1_METML|nr:EAL domain-containing protein [Methylotenera mobilis]ACT47333.1 diguanylate cyclase/phosphodiesterase with PAS/PAC sensor(s) [Methylotenera mobilis JLW8]
MNTYPTNEMDTTPRLQPKKSIRGEIRHLVLITVLTSLSLTFIFGAIYKINNEKQAVHSELETLAKITALNSQSSLVFNDARAAQEILQSLSARADVLDAQVLRVDGTVLAKKKFEKQTLSNDYLFVPNDALLSQLGNFLGISPSTYVTEHVTLKNTPLGNISIRFDTSIVLHEILITLGISLIITVVALLLSLLLMRRLIDHMMTPINLLINSAKDIAKKGMYGLRVKKIGDDELGIFTDQFNRMLEEIEKRDQALLSKNEQLEEEVARRTQALKENIEELKNSEFRWKFAIEGAGDGVWDWNIATDEAQYSKRWKEMLGYDENELLPTNQEWADRVHHDDVAYVKQTMQDYLEGKTALYVVEYRLKCKDNRYKWILGRGMIVSRDDQGNPLRMIGTHTDITERKKIEQQLRIAATAFESQEGIVVTNENFNILRVNQAFIDITGYEAEEATGKKPNILKSGRQSGEFYRNIYTSLRETGSWSGEIINRRKNGEIYPEHLTITAVKDADGQTTNYVGMFTDISVAKAASERIENLAFFDPLTNLPNRRLFSDRLTQALVNSTRSGNYGALVFLDLDHFKSLNDTLGHDYGDMLLKQVALRLSNCVREGDSVARLGGDEFVLLVENLSANDVEAAHQIEAIGDKILMSLNQPYQLQSHEYLSTPSIGISLFNGHQESSEDLLKHADIAMYQAKKAGRNTLRFFDPLMQETINMRVDLERELKKAIEQKQFELYYQVQMNSAGQPSGAEALIRWRHPERGIISPIQFIPVAEETGLITQIGEWVLNQACLQLQAWQLDQASKDFSLAINVSAKQFLQPDFANQVKNSIRSFHIDNTKLKLELTESMLIDNIEYVIHTMNTLGEIGIQFSLDDFGTGYSSLQYLKMLPLSQLKIDQSFVRDLATDNSNKTIVLTIITMAHSLGLNVIAEGVETDEQLQLLNAHGCGNYQGYYFSEPLSINEFNHQYMQFKNNPHSTFLH